MRKRPVLQLGRKSEAVHTQSKTSTLLDHTSKIVVRFLISNKSWPSYAQRSL